MPDPSPYFRFCPSDPITNVKWRIKVRKAAMHNEDVRATLRQAAFDDVLFFFQAFMWLSEPRAKIKVLPFCLWPHQIPAILAIMKAVGDSQQSMEEPVDVVVDKARAQGATWICLGIILWLWLRDDMFAAGLVSKNMEAVDNPNDPGSLMSKLDWAIKMLPFWMRPKSWDPVHDRLYYKHSLVNRDNGASIIGYAATADVMRSGRTSVVFFDEVAAFGENDIQDAVNSTQFVANCRWFVSTHKGNSGVYYEMVFGDAAGVKIVLDWKDNPTHNRLMYRFSGGMAVAERSEEQVAVNEYVTANRADFEKLKRRGFVKENRVRSPYYDRKCLQKGATPRGIAQELDRDPRGTVGKLMNTEVLDRMAREQCRAPVWEGTAAVYEGELRLMPQDGGPLKLWFRPGLDDEPPKGRFVVGADISMGMGGELSSNSALVGGDCTNGHQVLEYADPLIDPTRFARLAVAICRWLHEALLIWEAQGPTGGRFASEVVKEIDYPNVYMRESGDTLHREKTRKPGWVNNRTKHKADLFDDLWVSMDDRLFTPRSTDLIRECGGWEWSPDGVKIVYKGTGHGDRVIAGGLCWKGMKDLQQMGVDGSVQLAQDVRYGTLKWRMEMEKARRLRGREDDGEGFGLRELLSVGGW